MTETGLQEAAIECAQLLGGTLEWIGPEPPEWVSRFGEKVIVRPDGCWEWAAATSGDGYGAFKIDGRQVGAHQAAFFLANGEWLAPGLVVRHTCDNPRCVRPSHLLAGTHSDNVRDAVERRRHKESRKTHCPRGHEYDYIDPRGYRQCRTCRREALRRFKARAER